MKIKANTAPLETLIIEFNDKEFVCRFDTVAQYYIESEFEPFAELIDKTGTTPYLIAPKLLYAGLKSSDPTMTFDLALQIAGSMGQQGLTTVYNYVTKAMGGEEEGKKQIVTPQDHRKSTKKKKKRK